MNRELEIAVERAARAAVVDPLVEALEALRDAEAACVNFVDAYSSSGEFNTYTSEYSPKELRAMARDARKRARAVLAKYAPDRAGGGE